MIDDGVSSYTLYNVYISWEEVVVVARARRESCRLGCPWAVSIFWLLPPEEQKLFDKFSGGKKGGKNKKIAALLRNTYFSVGGGRKERTIEEEAC